MSRPRPHRPTISDPRRAFKTFALALVVALVAGMGFSACDAPFDITVDAGSAPLYPLFRRDASDYVNRCAPGQATELNLTVPDGTEVSIDGSQPKSGSFSTSVVQQAGKSFTIAVTTDGKVSTHVVRCLPTDFPEWQAERTGDPQAAFYATTAAAGFTEAGNYSMVFDTNGVPVWWRKRVPTFLFEPLPNGTFASINYTSDATITETALDGQVVESYVGPHGSTADFHDFQELANGNRVLVGNKNVPCDLSSWSPSLGAETCIGQTIYEVDTAGTVVWQWDANAHISPAETTQPWRDSLADVHQATPTVPWDNLHYNSIQEVPGGYIINFRHLDAAVRIDRASGNVVWKLGGTPTTESLAIKGDLFGGPSGEHDVRLEGSILRMYDNGTLGLGPSRAPRSLTYAIDTQAKTATLTTETYDGVVDTSGCCGSSRALPGGNVVTGWGGKAFITENAPDGRRVFLLRVAGIVYRAVPLLPGQFTAEQFRQGMDAQFAAGRL